MSDTLCYSECLLPSDDGFIRCDLCRQWYHKICAAKNDPELEEVLSKPKKTKIPFWGCWLCTNVFSSIRNINVAHSLQDLTDKFNECIHTFQLERESLLSLINDKTEENKVLRDLLLQFRILTEQKYGSLSENECPTQISEMVCSKRVNDKVPPIANINLSHIDSSSITESITKVQVVDIDITTDTHRQLKDKNKNVKVNEPRKQLIGGELVRTVVSDSNVDDHCLPNSDILIIGDSLLRNTHKHIKSNKKVHVALRPGAKVHTIMTEIGKLSENSSTKTVILHVGGNDILTSPSLDHIIGDLWSLIELVKAKFPAANIIVNGVIRRKGIPKFETNQLNLGIKWMANALNVSFGDPDVYLNPNDFARDGIHLNAKGVDVFSNYLKNSLTLVLPRPKT